MKGYNLIRRDIDRDFKEELINMYECRYEIIPDDDYIRITVNARGNSGEKFNRETQLVEYI